MLDFINSLLDKGKELLGMALKFVSGELLVLLIIAAGLAAYFVLGLGQKAKNAVKRKANKHKEEFYLGYADSRIQRFFDLMNGENKEAFLKGCRMYLDKNNYVLDEAAVRQMIYDYTPMKNEALRTEYVYGKGTENLIEAICKTIQIGLQEGPEYEKMQKQIKKSVKKQLASAPVDINSVSVQINSSAFQMQEGLNQQMQLQQDLQLQMQQQTQLDMQLQMQQQVQLDMQLQMQQQMQMDMQLQMQQQMQQQMQMDMQMQMQQQMQMDMQNSMNSANQAITSTDFGGHMNHDAHSGNFGPF